MGVPAVGAPVYFIGVMEILFHPVHPSSGAGAASLRQHLWRGNHADHGAGAKAVVPGGAGAVPAYFFEVVVCLLQAFVFTMLVVAFVGTLCTHADEEQSH